MVLISEVIYILNYIVCFVENYGISKRPCEGGNMLGLYGTDCWLVVVGVLLATRLEVEANISCLTA